MTNSTDSIFGTSALRLAGFCAVAFGWSPDAFWRATPAEVGAVVAALVPASAAPVTSCDLGAMIADLEKSCG